jgi:hypothetical protein
MNAVPPNPQIYHIVHVDRLPSIIADGFLWCDAEVMRRTPAGTAIGMRSIKERRLSELALASHPELYVGDCVPFYFCPRSVMLYLIRQGNHPELEYRGGQDPIVHLEANLRATVKWAEEAGRRWAFTSSNAGSYYFDDWCDLDRLGEIDWTAIHATQWSECKEGKQAEFLVEQQFPWELVTRIGASSTGTRERVADALRGCDHMPRVEVRPDWYY